MRGEVTECDGGYRWCFNASLAASETSKRKAVEARQHVHGPGQKLWNLFTCSPNDGGTYSNNVGPHLRWEINNFYLTFPVFTKLLSQLQIEEVQQRFNGETRGSCVKVIGRSKTLVEHVSRRKRPREV